MTDDIDRLLSNDEDIEPSPLFVRSVMAAVERAAAEPPPIPFPWRRGLPGLGVAVAAAAYVIANPPDLPPADALPAYNVSAAPAIWVTLGVLVSAVSTIAAIRFDACRSVFADWRAVR
jgi:hypothetical protein